MRFSRVWLVSFLLLMLLGGAWILASPMSGPPDEPTHVMRADAIVHGQLIGSAPRPGQPKAVTVVRVPEDLTELQRLASCFGQKPLVPAGCVQTIRGSQRQVPTDIYVGRYPPLYYLIVGIPSLLIDTPGVVYWMRLFSLAAGATFLSLALASAWRWSSSRLLVPAVAVAITPMTIYMASSVNPNGLEIAVAIGLWTTLLVLVLDHADDPPMALLAAAGTCAVVLPLTRGLSPAWDVAIGVTVVGLAWGRGLRSLLHRRAVQLWLAATGVSVFGAVAWVLGAGSLNQLQNTPLPPGTSSGHLVSIVVGQTGNYIQQYIGYFGSLDTLSPLVTFLVWVGATFVLVVLAFALAGRRVAVWLSVTIALAFTVPVLLELAEARSVGLIGQGRYYLPLVVGIILLAGASAGRLEAFGPALRRVGSVLIAMVAVGQVGAFVWALRRYVVGSTGPLNPLARVVSGWAPPINPLVLDLLVVIVAAAYAVWAIRLTMTDWQEEGAVEVSTAAPSQSS